MIANRPRAAGPHFARRSVCFGKLAHRNFGIVAFDRVGKKRHIGGCKRRAQIQTLWQIRT
jgi:hypothetical protein